MWANIPYENLEATCGSSEQISYFRELITDEFMEAMAEQTNLYSVLKDGKSIDSGNRSVHWFVSADGFDASVCSQGVLGGRNPLGTCS